MSATCIVTNCLRTAPSGEPYCNRHRDKPVDIETLERVRRIETKLTQFMTRSGVDIQVQKPNYIQSGGIARVILPSPHCSIKEILDSIPAAWDGPVKLFVGDELVATLDGRKG